MDGTRENTYGTKMRRKRRDVCWFDRQRPDTNAPRKNRFGYGGILQEFEEIFTVRKMTIATRQLFRQNTSAPTEYSQVRGERAKRIAEIDEPRGLFVKIFVVQEMK